MESNLQTQLKPMILRYAALREEAKAAVSTAKTEKELRRALDDKQFAERFLALLVRLSTRQVQEEQRIEFVFADRRDYETCGLFIRQGRQS